ncbi:MAG: hypothetical protein SVU32_05615 [Candidatus Nanohaloarchaea archaeon]|nr:hypothetical protein [Candidatus Nanohaloarchaea archaeon]
MGDPQESFYKLAPHLVDSEVSSDGKIQYADRRFVFFHSDMFAELFDNMEDVAGPVIQRKVKDFGFQAGKEIAEKMDEDFKDVGLLELLRLLFATWFDIGNMLAIRPTDPEAQMQKIFGYGRYVGWLGPATILEYEEGHAVFRFEDTFESYSYGETGEVECRFTTGVIKGLCAFYWNDDDLEAEHEKCRCKGDEYGKTVIQRAS